MPIAPAQSLQIVGNTPDTITVAVGSSTIELNKAQMKQMVKEYRCSDQLRWAIILRLLAQQTDLTSNAAIKADVESGVYFY
jgi:hypothetical protein